MWQAEADIELTLCASCPGRGLNSVNHGEVLLEYGTVFMALKYLFHVYVYVLLI